MRREKKKSVGEERQHKQNGEEKNKRECQAPGGAEVKWVKAPVFALGKKKRQ